MLARVRDMLLSKARQSGSQKQNPVHIATMVLLIEAAMAEDDRLDDQELDYLCNVAMGRFGIEGSVLRTLLDEARTAQRDGNDLWQFTNELNEALNREEKREVMKNLWEVFYLDGHLGGHEDHLAHKVAELLRLTHRDLIEAKMAARRPPRAPKASG